MVTHQMASTIFYIPIKLKYYRALSKISVINRLHNRDRGFFENSIVKVSKILHLDKLLNTEKINQKLQNTIKQYDFETSDLVGNVLGSYRERELAYKEVFGSHNSLILKPLKSVDMLIRMLI